MLSVISDQLDKVLKEPLHAGAIARVHLTGCLPGVTTFAVLPGSGLKSTQGSEERKET